MGLIRVLPEAVANTIAAGEVIERPASIVKELVENALDAGATAVEVEIRHGGTSFIQVSDNGCGMRAEDVPLAFERHATSKIASAEDLLRIRSLGFRGEALPSIAAVSRTRLVTGQPPEAAGIGAGTQIQMDGGRRVLLTPCPPRTGTLVEVRDLFFNTPARRKFLRSHATETGHILDTVVRLALAHWRVHFRLASPARVLLEVEPARSLLERARTVFGGETARHLVPVEGESHGVRVTGLIGKPFVARANRSGQHWFVNGRWVRSLPLSFALQDGFAGLLMHGQFPIAALFLELDPAQVDVNVHPTKQEVRLSDEPALKRFLAGLIAQRLRQERDLAPRLQPSRVFQPAHAPMQLEAVAPERETAVSVREPEGEYLTAPTTQTLHEEPSPDRFRIVRLLGQLHGTFIVAETEEGLLLADQHAAHERVMFEALRRSLDTGRPECQPLLTEAMLELSPSQWEAAEETTGFLRKIGFDVEPFGERALLIRGLPAVLGDQDPVVILRRFFEEREDGALRSGLERASEDLAALIACKRSSVRANEPLTPEAMRSLLSRLARCAQPFTCPHGRPTVITYPMTDLLRHFKRT